MRAAHYIPTLDGWRTVAIGLVLFCHASVGIGLGAFKEVGLLGVQIFFGLSGFLITTLLLAEERRSGTISLAGFYRRRAFRIIPAAGVYLAVVGFLAVAGAISMTFGRWAGSLFFMANYSSAAPSWYVAHFWSLAVEEHFYLIWPAVLLLVGGRKRLMLAIVAAIAVALWRAIDFKYHLTWTTNSAWFWGRSDIQADGIIFGVIFALAFDRIKQRLAHPLTAPLAIVVFALTVILPPFLDWKLGFLLLTVRAAAVPVMILGTMNCPESHLGRLLELRPVRFIGRISYSLYLWQQLFLAWEPTRALFAVQWFPVNIAAAFLCATLSFYLVETPLIALGRALGKKRPLVGLDVARVG